MQNEIKLEEMSLI